MNLLSNFRSKSLLARAILSSEPNYMVMFVTAVCNARCPMCFYWEEIESANAKRELRLEEYQKISENLNELHYLSIGGGEPFIRKDLPHIVENFYRNSNTRIVTVATNGAYPERVRNYVGHLRQHCPDLQMRIQVSVDNLYDKHDESRQLKGLFAKLLKTCQVIGELKAGAPLMFSIGTVLTPFNRDNLQEIRLFLDENTAYDDLSLIYPRGNAKDPYYKAVSVEEYREAKKWFDAIPTQRGSFARLYQSIDRQSKEGIESFLKHGPDGYPWTCVAGERMITLTEQGLLTPCEMLYQLKPDLDSSLGNVRDHNYEVLAMLASDRAKKLRQFIVDTHCSCSYECAAACNVVFHKSQWPQLAKRILFD